MIVANLQPFLRSNLDVLFVGLNPPVQSNAHGHYFSGKQSRFFQLLIMSGLIVRNVDKVNADVQIFGDSQLNYHHAQYGVVDLIPTLVETDSTKVQAANHHVTQLIAHIYHYQPRIVCIIHSKIQKAFNRSRHADLIKPLTYGGCGPILRNCSTAFFLNYFPNGNAIADSKKIRIFDEIKALL